MIREIVSQIEVPMPLGDFVDRVMDIIELVADKPERAYVPDPSVPASGPPAPPGEDQAPTGG